MIISTNINIQPDSFSKTKLISYRHLISIPQPSTNTIHRKFEGTTLQGLLIRVSSSFH